MDRKQTQQFIRDAKAFQRRKKWTTQTLSKHLFNKNPYGFERLEKALKEGEGGPPHVNVLEAMETLRALEKKADEEDRVFA